MRIAHHLFCRYHSSGTTFIYYIRYHLIILEVIDFIRDDKKILFYSSSRTLSVRACAKHLFCHYEVTGITIEYNICHCSIIFEVIEVSEDS
jgi:hypothetical protein